MNHILAIDPGTTHSGVCLYSYCTDPDKGIIEWAEHMPNHDVLRSIELHDDINSRLAIEMVGHYGTGMPAGKTTFLTCLWIGRFVQQAAHVGFTPELYLRKTIVAFLCGSVRGKGGNVTQALIDRLGPKGTKKAPGPTFGMSNHKWSALAVAIAAAHNQQTVDIGEAAA